MSEKKFFLNFLLIAIAATTILGIIFFYWQEKTMPNIKLMNRFVEKELIINSNNLFDIGVVDYNNDEVYDIFTSNHHSRQSLLEGKGKFEYRDVLSEVNLDHQPLFPEIEINSHPPNITESGLYIFFLTNTIRMVWISDNSKKSISGKFTLSSNLKITNNNNFFTDINTIQKTKNLQRNTVTFEATGSAAIEFNVEFVEVPISFQVNSTLPLKDIKIGNKFISPKNHNFTLFLNYRRGMAWADFNKDHRTDLFIVRGGLKGQIKLFSEEFDEIYYDELFINNFSEFVNITQSRNLIKGCCPGYNTYWIDYDQDNNLDLYVTCHHNSNNMLHRNLGNGNFENVAHQIGLDQKSALADTPFAWLDFDDDGDLDLLLVTDQGIEEYKNYKTKFLKTTTYYVKGVIKISQNDYDSDGDIDLFVSSYSGNTCLLINIGNGFQILQSTELGLPAFSLYGNWTDYDNDGYSDLFIVPHGIFKQNPDNTFSKTGILEHQQPKYVKRARSTWCDLDNDGDLDLLLGIYHEDPLWKIILNRLLSNSTPEHFKSKDNHGVWRVRIYENKAEAFPKNNWLQILLKDYRANTDAIGAKLKIKMGKKEIAAQTGQSEGSMTSQGHYRLYFGLGKYKDDMEVEIIWPDGQRQLENIDQVNQLVSLCRGNKI